MAEAGERIDWASGTGQQLYRRAKTRIPGGTQLLSKRPEMFLPDQWPAYFSRAKGCEVWDLDGRKFVDFTTMGIGSALLGYADDDVDRAVKERIDRGNMATLNCPEEVELADLLCELHPWADAVRYCRTGGETLAMAVRIARAHAGRDLVAFCGYHGWHDWYLAANLGGEGELDGHLLPGLDPAGVPKGLAGTVRPFAYNRIEELESIVTECGDRLGVIVTEPFRSELPRNGFLEKVRAIAEATGAVLIFDEVSAGWRFTTGGAHLMLGVEPDLAAFAKAISNGYPMGAVIGRGEVMAAAQSTFVSSTYWTEGVGPAAALAAIKKNRAVNVPHHVETIGRLVMDGWRQAGERAGLPIEVSGFPALCHFSFDPGPSSQALATLFTQEMLDRGYLTGTRFYPSYAHTPQHVDAYLSAVAEAFTAIADAVDRSDVEKRLRGPDAHTGFRRLVN